MGRLVKNDTQNTITQRQKTFLSFFLDKLHTQLMSEREPVRQLLPLLLYPLLLSSPDGALSHLPLRCQECRKWWEWVAKDLDLKDPTLAAYDLDVRAVRETNTGARSPPFPPIPLTPCPQVAEYLQTARQKNIIP